MPGFTTDGFTDDAFITADLSLAQSIIFLYNTSKAGTSFANDKLEKSDLSVSMKLK